MSDYLETRCPKCGRCDRISVEVTAWMNLTEDGTDDTCADTDVFSYTPRSLTMCNACGHSGRLSSFETPASAGPS